MLALLLTDTAQASCLRVRLLRRHLLFMSLPMVRSACHRHILVPSSSAASSTFSARSSRCPSPQSLVSTSKTMFTLPPPRLSHSPFRALDVPDWIRWKASSSAYPLLVSTRPLYAPWCPWSFRGTVSSCHIPAWHFCWFFICSKTMKTTFLIWVKTPHLCHVLIWPSLSSQLYFLLPLF